MKGCCHFIHDVFYSFWWLSGSPGTSDSSPIHSTCASSNFGPFVGQTGTNLKSEPPSATARRVLNHELVTIQRTSVRRPRLRRQSCACQILPFEKPSSRRIEGIAHSERTKSLWEGSLAENKETRRCVCAICVVVYLFSFLCIRLWSIGDIILYDSHLVVYKHSLDLILYFIAGSTENEVMLYSALTSLTDALTMLLRNSLEKRGVLENLDLVLLCLDETIDDGWESS